MNYKKFAVFMACVGIALVFLQSSIIYIGLWVRENADGLFDRIVYNMLHDPVTFIFGLFMVLGVFVGIAYAVQMHKKEKNVELP